MENLGPGAADMVVAFSSGDVEDFGLRASIGAMATEVMANTCASSTADVRGVARSSERIVMDRATEPVEITDAARVAGPLRFDVEATSPPIVNEYGSARTAGHVFWPALQAYSMFSLRIGSDGMREPHGQPETAERGASSTAGRG